MPGPNRFCSTAAASIAPVHLRGGQCGANGGWRHRPLLQIAVNTQRPLTTGDPLAHEALRETFIALQAFTGESQQLIFHGVAVVEASTQFASQLSEGMLPARQQVHCCQAYLGGRRLFTEFRRGFFEHREKRRREWQWDT
ncbi:MAG: hypothetical protein U5K56_05940 [Halioglobus sp.]|nr:hypothetical protein [Halioglobus sp.]